MGQLTKEFDELERQVQQLIALLIEADENFWARTFARGLPRIQAHELAGATYVLGCYGGVDTFSDFSIAAKESDSLNRRNLNARLAHQRTATFEAADAIAARRSW